MGADDPVIQDGSGDGDGGNRISWMGTPWDGGSAVGVEVGGTLLVHRRGRDQGQGR